MGTASVFVAVICVLALASTQGYVMDRPSSDRPGSTGLGGSRPGSGTSRPGGFGGSSRPSGPRDRPGVVSRRDEPKQILPDAVEQLIDQIRGVVEDYHHGVSTSRLAKGLMGVALQARHVIDMTSTVVTEKDVLKFVAGVSSSFLKMLYSDAEHESPTLGFAINLLSEIADRIVADPNRMVVAVHAIEETAGSLSQTLTDIGEVFEHVIRKRQTTYGGSVDTGPDGTSVGVHGSHTTSGGTTYGGHVEHGPGGTSGGASASHTWDHSDGSKTSVGGYVDHSSQGGTSGGISVTHTFPGRKRRQTSVGGSLNTGPAGPTIGVHGSHTSGGTTLGGHLEHGPYGTSGGLSGSHTSGGTTFGGHIDHGPFGTSGGISGSHTSGGSTFGGHLNHGPGGTSGGLSGSHTWTHSGGGSTSVGGYVDHSPGGGTSGGIRLTHSFGSRQRPRRQTTYGGHVETGPGGTSGTVHGSHTHTHSDGSKSTVGGHVSHSTNDGTSGGVSFEHTSGGK